MSGSTPPPGDGGSHDPTGSGQPPSPTPGGWGQPPSGSGQPPSPASGGWGQPPSGSGPSQSGWGQPSGPSPSPWGPPGPPPPDYAQWGPGTPGGPPAGPPDDGPGGAGRRGTKALILGLAMVVLLGGGAFAFYQADPFNLFRPGPQAAEALPADAIVYFGVDLDPSAEQKVNALRFLQKFPEFEDVTGIRDARDDVRRTIVEDALESADCPDVRYDDDIEPWIGNRFGVALLPGSEYEPEVAMALETSDVGAAQEGLRALARCNGETLGVAGVGDFVVVAETQRQADRYAAEAEESSLADSDTFEADMESLGDLGLASLWLDIDGAVEAMGDGGMFGAEQDLAAASFQRVAATFRFEPASAEIVSSAYGEVPAVDPRANRVVDLPETTAFAMSMSGGEESLLEGWDTILDSAEQDGLDIQQVISDFEAETGLSVPDDLATVLGENLLFAVDSESLTPEVLEAEDPSRVDLGVRMTNDPAELNAVYEKVLGLMQEEIGEVPFTKQDAEDGIVIATNDGYADELAELDGDLGDSDVFRSVVDDAESQQFVLFFNWDSVEPRIIEAMEADGEPQDVIDNVRPLRAIGVSSGLDGDYATMSLQVSVDD